jgi:hypothetical protein
VAVYFITDSFFVVLGRLNFIRAARLAHRASAQHRLLADSKRFDTAIGLNGGLTYRPFPGPRSWVRFVVGFIMFVVLMPFFALKELGRATGDDNLYDLFFVRRGRYMPPQS